ncbi:hypothetical protein K3172_02460 [Qipengyuania sp. 6B39]|uniref:asparagine synthase-related protein n=1 Tax=Qipengyuania proteolytica TaxID=2867239 RepID=UPI001C8A9C18|nr:asparagine synthetase B family protein [Qipengyuania proteolytica]MBX7494715.1 hypothetical protein [Qipengyuania proteolytica]
MFLISSKGLAAKRGLAGPFLSFDGRQAPAHWSSENFDCWSAGERRAPDSSTLLLGRIDNFETAREQLCLGREVAPAALYHAAVQCWGDEADKRLIGHYSAVTILGPRRLRLVRSPWTAPPLHFVARDSGIVASPILNALFATGVEREIDYEHLADQLAFDHHDLEPRGWFRGIGRVPLGTRIFVEGDRISLDRYYDPVAIPEVRFAKDDDYVAAARELLDEAARHALAGARRPAVMLSGGLDSPIVADALLRAMPGDAPLPSYTHGPIEGWDGISPPGSFGDDRPFVREFARLHPRLLPRFPDPAPAEHDYRLRELLDYTASPTANIANIGFFHNLLEAAAGDGCDTVLTGMLGNFTISLDGRWAAPEYARKMRVRALWALVSRQADGDSRSAFRRLLAEGILPNLPLPLQTRVRSLVHPALYGSIPPYALLTDAAKSAWSARSRTIAGEEIGDPAAIERSREEAIRGMWASADSGEDLDLGLERMHRITFRDVTAYRPLIEFCHGLPTDQLVRNGVSRYLARRMAKGIMPEDQRRNTSMGRHNADWHTRISTRREELARAAERIALHPQLGQIVDVPRMVALLQEWPDRTPVDPGEELPRALGLTRALTAATFVAHSERRNAF